MINYAVPLDRIDRLERFRWSFSAVVVLALYGMIALAVFVHQKEEDVKSGSPIVMVDLAPTAVAPSAAPSDLAPAPQARSEVQEQTEQDEKPEQKQMERVPDEASQPNPAVALPKPVPSEQPKQNRIRQQEQEASAAAAPPSAPATAERAAAPAPVLSWQRSLVAHLERFKRYPSQAHGLQGSAMLAFRIDRNGHVLSSKIVQSSGSAILDEETLALIARAAPLPAPPRDVTDSQLSFVIPIKYAKSAGSVAR